jgi:hypothetical protein
MPYDFFISYSSFDVAVARRIAEQLISRGYNVWFDEYVILLDGRGRFQDAIDEGIANSRCGLLIVGERYAASEYCRREAKGLSCRLSAGATVAFLLGPQAEFKRAFTSLADSAIQVGSEQPDNEILRKLKGLRLTAEALEIPSRSSDPDNRWHVREAALSFARSNWALVPGSQFRAMVWNDLPAPEGGTRSEFQMLSWLGGCDIRLSFDYERVSGESARKLMERHQLPPSGQESSDRARLEDELSYFDREREILFRNVLRAPSLAAGPPDRSSGAAFKEVGVHLHRQGIGGVALKHRLFTLQERDSGRFYRIYKLAFLHPVFDDQALSVRMLFELPASVREAFGRFHECEALVQSLRLAPPTNDWDDFNRLFELAAKRERRA